MRNKNFYICEIANNEFDNKKVKVERTCKGFTLHEFVVVMAVSAVVMSLVIMLVMSVSDFTHNKAIASEQRAEIAIFKNELNGAFEQFQQNDISVIIADNGASLCAVDGNSEQFIIAFKDKMLKFNNEDIATFKHINNVTFFLNGDLVKCNVTYGNDLTIVILLSKRC
jgi:prepilin-type N-terminal cleavage/methylation domain-containing protein